MNIIVYTKEKNYLLPALDAEISYKYGSIDFIYSQSNDIDCVLIDSKSTDFFKDIPQYKNYKIPVIIILDPEDNADEFFRYGFFDFIYTPLSALELKQRINALIIKFEKKLHISQRENRFRELADSIHEGFVLLNGQNISYVNNHVEELTGYSKEELLSMSILDLVSKESKKAVEMNISLDGQVNAKLDFFIWIDRKDGNKGFIHFHNVPFLRADGTMGRIIMLRDYSHDTDTVRLLQESEERFENLAEVTPMAIMLYQDSYWVYVNQSAEEITGFTKEELYKQHFWEIVHPDFRELVQQRGEKRESNEYAEPQYEFQIICKDGSAIWVYLSGSSTTHRGKPAGLISVIDINERKINEEKLKRYALEVEASNEELQAAMEELESTNEEFETINDELITSKYELEQSEKRFRNIFQNTPVGIFQTTPAGKFIAANPETVRILGYESEEELMEMSNIALDLYSDPRERERFLELINRDKEVKKFETQFKRKNGEQIWVLLNARASINEQGVIEYYDGYVRDISSQNAAEENLKESEARFRALHNASFGGIGIHDKGIILELNQGLCDISGYEYNELMGMNGLLLISEKYRDLVMNNILSGYEKPYRAEGLRKDGSVFPLEIHGKKIPYHGKEVRVTEFRDITEAVNAENELKMKEQQLHDIAVNIPGVIYQFYARPGKEYGLYYVSEKSKDVFGIDNDAEGFFERFVERVSPEETEYFIRSVDKAVSEKSNWDYIGRFVKPDGTLMWFKSIATPASVTNDNELVFNGLLFDLTSERDAIKEREKLEEQLRQAQKMEAIGRLAGGIAHDFNNLLTAIIGNTDLALLTLQEDDVIWENIKEISSTADRAAELTKQLLAFSRKQIIKPVIINLSLLLNQLESMLKRVIGEDIELNFSVAPDIQPIKADPSQIEQLIVNLAVNARDAMPKGGKLSVITSNLIIDDESSSEYMNAPNGHYIELKIVDNGIGIPQQYQDQIFEPFFTTKGDMGTGLGLATVYGVVKQNKGFIVLDSEEGKGTTFKILLPATSSNIENNLSYKNEVEEKQNKGNEVILLVEDEDSVRKMAFKSLIKFGYQVIETSRGREAIEKCRTTEEHIDLVLTDVLMPDINGPDIIPHIRECFPDIKILFMSGYTEESIVNESVLLPEINFIAKPFRPVELIKKIQDVLNQE